MSSARQQHPMEQQFRTRGRRPPLRILGNLANAANTRAARARSSIESIYRWARQTPRSINSWYSALSSCYWWAKVVHMCVVETRFLLLEKDFVEQMQLVHQLPLTVAIFLSFFQLLLKIEHAPFLFRRLLSHFYIGMATHYSGTVISYVESWRPMWSVVLIVADEYLWNEQER